MANRGLSVQELLGHFKGRRAGIIRALTTDAELFYQQCDPEEEPMSLYGLPNGTWELRLPEEMVPPDLPEPTLGVNFGKAETSLDQWLQTVAAHSDSWLIAAAFSIASNFRFGKKQRETLFKKINDLPTVLEVVKQFYQESPATSRSNSQATSGERMHARQSQVIAQPQEAQEDEEDDIPCGSCGLICEGDEFWIFCDVCKIWYHGACVDMTPEIAGLMKKYTCPNCSRKRPRV
ncbi:PHD finger protein ALFIN-LIKE 3-like [Eucalyptus grandis]|uniref:PHD finger protein ALFIN-LIKE 3-like n=1 Tax=Eucalyptus grandis TaxID=71139 RepID=UPI00192EBE96|nr:PHD finger protein ALFIN-LIKE 3-like [Eucalyptus grandis]